MKVQPSLGRLLPGLIIVLVAASVISATGLQYVLQRQHLIQVQKKLVQQELGRFGALLGHSLTTNQNESLQAQIRQFADTAGYSELFVINDQQRVVASAHSTMDTSLIERLPPSAGSVLMGQWLVVAQPLADTEPTFKLVARYNLQPMLAGLPGTLIQQAIWVLILTSTLALLLLWILKRWVISPLNQAIAAASHLEHGDFSIRLPNYQTREFQRLADHFNQMGAKLAENLESMTERKGLLQAFADSLPDLALVLSEEGRCLGVFGDLGLLRSGVSQEQLIDSLIQPHLITEQARTTEELITQALTTGEHQRTEYDLLTQGGLRHFVARVVPMPALYRGQRAVLWLASDTTEAHTLQTELHLMATAFETLEGIAITDSNLRILKTNQAFEQLSGFPPEQSKQRPLLHLLCDHDQNQLLERLHAELRQRGHWSGEIWHQRMDGSHYPAYLTVTAVVTGKGSVGHYVAMFMDITERKNAERLIAWQAQYDPLTELPNRRYFLDRLDEQVALSRRRKLSGAVLFIDLDHFKPINDSLGHAIGDALLKAVTQRLQKRLRREDFFARIGGDEFVVLLPAVDANSSQLAGEAHELAEALLKLLSEPFQITARELYLGASIGYCVYPAQGDNSQDILRRADSAMYAAKRHGRGLVRQFNPSMESDNELRAARLSELHRALDQNEFVLYYQPQYNAAGEIVVAEALIRWRHPSQGLLAPGSFIPIAEDSGLIIRLGEWVLQEAGRQVREWLERGLLPRSFRHISVNVSARQFAQPQFADLCLEAAETAGIDPNWLELELTETVLADNLLHVSTTLTVLRDAGFHFAIDDFGTGYCSLHYLKRLPVETLKIDRMFIRDVTTSESDARIVETIIAMARNLELQVVAEGVETEEQRRFLIERGCELYQGFLLAKPLPVANLEQLFQRQGQESASG